MAWDRLCEWQIVEQAERELGAWETPLLPRRLFFAVWLRFVDMTDQLVLLGELALPHSQGRISSGEVLSMGSARGC